MWTAVGGESYWPVYLTGHHLEKSSNDFVKPDRLISAGIDRHCSYHHRFGPQEDPDE